MHTDRHVVVVTMHATEAARWRDALRTPPALPAGDRVAWHVVDTSRGGTGLARWLGRAPDLEERAERLERHLAEPPFIGSRAIDDPQITLVGCRAACHLVQEFVLRELREGADVRSVRRLRQILLVNPVRLRRLRLLLAGAVLAAVIQVAGPSLMRALGVGAPWSEAVQTLATCLAVVLPLALGVLLSDEAQRRLGIRMRLDHTLADEAFRDVVEQGAKDRPASWPVPTRMMRVTGAIPGDAETVARLAVAAARPAAHPNLYVVEAQRSLFRIRPVCREQVPANVREQARADRRAIVFDDDETIVRRSVRFAANSASGASPHLSNWMLRYGTFEGFLVADVVHQDNRWKPMDMERDYLRNHERYTYEFSPQPAHSYEITLRVYGGFTGSEQCSHVHLRSDTHYERVDEAVDLSQFVAAGWTLLEPPRVTFVQEPLPPVRIAELHGRRQLVGLSCRCAEQDRSGYEKREVPVQETAPGVYSWSIEDVRDGGVLEFRYRMVRDAHVAGG
jgi:hypothetical protein